MTENPYAPPSAELDSNDSFGGTGGTGDFDVGRCVSEAWEATWANFPLWLGFGIAFTVLALLSTLTIVGLILAVPHLVFGSAYFVLRMHDREAEFADLFVGFSDYGRVLVNMVVAFLVLGAISLVFQLPQYVATYADSTALLVVSYAIYFAFALFVSPRLNLAYFYLVDQDTTGVESVRLAWERTDLSKWKCALLTLVSLAIIVVGMLALLIGIIPASAMIYLMWASAFRQIEGRAASV